jgi:hypothetical protein
MVVYKIDEELNIFEFSPFSFLLLSGLTHTHHARARARTHTHTHTHTQTK